MALSARIGADFSEFTAALDKVEVKVKTASEIAKNAGRDFDKLVASFDGTKVQRDAQLMVTAIEKLGGAGKLTAAEQAKVNTQVQEAIAKYHALGQQAPPAMQALADATKQAAVHQQSFLDSVLATAAGFVTAQAALAVFHAGYSAVKAVLLGSVQAASEEEIALTKLRTALIQQGTAAPSVIAAYEGLARQYERTTVFSDHLLQSTMGTLAVVGGVMPRDMDTALRAVTNLASAFGGEQGLDKATLAVAKAAEGNITGLKRMGVVVDENKYKTEGFSAVLDAINAKFGGQAQALAETYTGRLTQMANAWDAVKEGIGHAIVQNRTVLETIASVTGAVQGNTADLAKNAEVMNLVSDATILLVRGFGLAGSAADLAQLTFQSLRIATEQTLAATANLAIGFLDTFVRVQNLQKFVNPSAWTSGSQQATKDAAAASAWLKGMVKGLDADSLDAIDDSIKYGNALQGLSAKADALAAQLKTTRGKVSALKEGTDSGTDAWNRHTVAVGKVATETEKLAKAEDAMSGQKLIADANDLVATYERLAAQGLKPTYAELVKVNVIMAEATAAAQRNGSTIPTAWAQVTLASKSLSDHMGAYATAAQNAADQSDAINEAVSVLPSRARATGQAFDETTEAMRRMANLMPEVKDQTTEINAAFDDLAKKKAEAMRKALGNVTDAMDGFSRVAEMAGHKTTASIASVASTTIKAFASGGPVAGAIALVTGLFTALGDKLFKTAQKALNDTRDLFITSQGGFDALNVAAAKAGAQSSFLALLQAKNTKTYEAALTKLNTILQKTSELEAARIAAVPVWETVSALAQKYGISVEAAGQAVQQLMITANAKTMINDWQTWAKAGGNMDAMAAGMAKSMSTLVQQSLAFGTTLPENLRPVLDFLSGAGILVDAAGNKIDVGSLSFGPEVQTEMERMTKAIEDLVAELRALNGLPAASTGLSGLVAEQNARMGASWKTAEYGGEQALGGDYLVTRPTLFLAGEAGPERATFRPAGGGSSQPIVITVISTLDGREVARNQVRYLPNQLKLSGF